MDDKEYEELRQAYQAVWNPANRYIADKVDDLVAIRWELNRLREVRRQFLARVFNDVKDTCGEALQETSAVTETEVRANTQSGPLARFDLRIRRCQIEISRVERDILRVTHHFAACGTSKNSLKTNDVEPTEPDFSTVAGNQISPNPGSDSPVTSDAALNDESPLPRRAAGSKQPAKQTTFRNKRRRRRSYLPS